MAPPKTLTRSEFRRLRPRGSYKKYLAYIQRHRPPPSEADLLTQQATAMVNASLDPLRREYDRAADERMADAIAASEAAKGFTSAFGRAQGAIPNTAGAALQAAAAALQGYAGGVEGRAQDIADRAGADAAASVARLTGLDVPMPTGQEILDVPSRLAEIDSGVYIGRAPLVTSTLHALDTASRGRIADWADIQRHKGVEEAGDIREKWLSEAAKRPGLIQQAVLALTKDQREQRALDITAAKLRLDNARYMLDKAETEAEIAKWTAETERASRELDAKIAGEGYYSKPPPKGDKPTKKDRRKLIEKRDGILADITGEDGLDFARKTITDKNGNYIFGTKNLPRQRLIRLLASHYWPLLRGYAGKGTSKQLNQRMMASIIKLVDALAEQYPVLAKGYKPPKAEPSTEDEGDNEGNPFPVP